MDRRFISLSPAALPVIHRAIGEAPLGDYYEFGCFRGWLLARAQRALPAGRSAWGFDSFQGLPETDAPDFVRGQFAGDLETVQRDLARTGFDFGRGELIEGFFAAALRWLGEGVLQPGLVVLLDDWHAAGGQREAFEAWLAGSRWRSRSFAEWPKHGVGWQFDHPQAPRPLAG